MDETSGGIAVVTGATRGMGVETSRRLLGLGFHVVMTGRRMEALADARTHLDPSGPVELVELDVTSPDDAGRLASRLAAMGKPISVLVNNAGAFFEPTDQSAYMSTSVFTVGREALLRSFETNTLGALYVSQAVIPLMRAAGYGRVVNISSGMGSIATMDRGWPAYRISKAALNAVTRLLAAELAGTDIKVNSADPGWVRTNMGGAGAAKSVEEGVDTALWLATLPANGPTGGFFSERQPMAW